MTLHSVSKDDSNRRLPVPNSADIVFNPKAHNTSSITYRMENSGYPQRVIDKNGLTLSYDDQNRVIKINGFELRVANYPIEIQAKYGYDVYTDILGIPPPIV